MGIEIGFDDQNLANFTTDQLFDDSHRRRLAQVVNIGFVCQPQARNCRLLESFCPTHYAIHHLRWFVLVHFPCLTD